MSDFLGRVGRITEWVVVSNLENRAVNAACDKAQGWWHDRKQKKHHDGRPASAGPAPPAPSQMGQPEPKSVASFAPQQQPQASYMPPPPPPSMGPGQLSINVSHVDGLTQAGPLIVVMECNHQRYQVRMGQPQQCSFPVYQFDYDQLCFWIQTEHQQQTIAHGEIPVRILLNGNNTWAPSQQRWIPLRDYNNAPAGQLLVNVEYNAPYAGAGMAPGPSPPPPYGYYS